MVGDSNAVAVLNFGRFERYMATAIAYLLLCGPRMMIEMACSFFAGYETEI